MLKRREVRPLEEEKIASPISSDDEDDIKTKHKATVLQKVKTEEAERNKELNEDFGKASSQIIKQADEEDDDVDIDELIRKFKSEDISFNTI